MTPLGGLVGVALVSRGGEGYHGRRFVKRRPGKVAVVGRSERGREELARLVRQAQGGDRAAFEELYRRTAQAQFFLMANKVGYEAANDLLQELYLIAWRNIQKIDPASALGYLGATGRNLCRRHLEQRHGVTRGTATDDATLERESTDTAGVVNGESIVARDQANDPAVTTSTRDEHARLARALREELTDFERTCVVMRYYQGAKIDDIAEALDSSRNTVKRTLSRALMTLRTKMGLAPWGALGLSVPLADVVEARMAAGARALERRRNAGWSVATAGVGLAAAGVTAGAIAFAVLAPAPTGPAVAEVEPEPVAIEEGAVPTASTAKADTAAPVLESVQVEGEQTVLRLADASGVRDVWCEGADGTVHQAVSHESAGKTGAGDAAAMRSAWRFALPSGTYTAHAADEAGNEAAGEITVEVYPDEPAPLAFE